MLKLLFLFGHSGRPVLIFESTAEIRITERNKIHFYLYSPINYFTEGLEYQGHYHIYK
jgi:hypothetical protein